MSLTFGDQAKKDGLNAQLDVLNSGFMDVCDASNVVLAVLTFAATAFGAAAGSGTVTKTANAIGSDASADATGTASKFKAYKTDHTTLVMSGTVGTSGADAIINTTAIAAGATVSCSSMVITAGG
jgi:hypothetical protein